MKITDAHGGMYATLQEVQCVWMAVSVEPRSTIREIACRTGLKNTKVHEILKFLQAARFIQQQKNCTGHKVLIPFVVEWTIPPKEPITEPEAG